MREVTCVVLAAGSASRMGGEKLSRPFRSGTILDAVLDACRDYPTVVVASTATIEAVPRLRDLTTIPNDEPEKGMAHSLRLANGTIDPDSAILVLLADKPLVTPGLIAKVIEGLGDADVAFPQNAGVPGHPVAFSPVARALVVALPDGDNVHLVRDAEFLVRRPLPIQDEGAYVDVDTEEEYRRLANEST